jgi:hypothetical protein
MRELSELIPREPVNPLATPPLENIHLPGLSPCTAPTVYDVLLDNILHRSPSPKVGSRTSTPISASHLSASTKGGDAVGQPRKSPTRSPIRAVEMRTEAARSVNITIRPPSPRIDFTGTNSTISTMTTQTMSSPPPSPISPTEGAFSHSMRGVKRGLARTPPSSSTGGLPTSPSSYNALRVHSALQRSTSSVSVASIVSSDRDERPAKRRTGQTSPLGKTGLSSPPPSRETSPVIEDVKIEERDTIAPLPTRIPKKLQRPRPVSAVVSVASSLTQRVENISAPARRNAVTGSASAKKGGFDTPAGPQRSQVSIDSPVTKIPVPVKRESRRMMLTPPKFARGMLAKIGGSSPGE